MTPADVRNEMREFLRTEEGQALVYEAFNSGASRTPEFAEMKEELNRSLGVAPPGTTFISLQDLGILP